MKTAVLCLACGLSAPLLARAQARAELGLKGGLSLAALHAGRPWYEPFNPYFHAGVYYRRQVTGRLAVQPELLYSLQGGNIADTQVQYDTKLHYLVLPVLAKLLAGRFFVEAGPQVGYLLGASQAGLLQPGTASAPAVYASSTRSATGQYARADLSLVAGLGGRLRVVSVGGRFTQGLTEASPGLAPVGSRGGPLRNRVVQLYVAVPVRQ